MPSRTGGNTAVSATQNCAAIAAQIIGIKRFWQGKGLNGLLHRHDDEAKLVQGAKRSYLPEELVRMGKA